jgi:hypothetical protein
MCEAEKVACTVRNAIPDEIWNSIGYRPKPFLAGTGL